VNEQFLAWGWTGYGICLALLIASRGMDFLSTWLATPRLLLEANPLARRLGWKWGLIVNGVLCLAFSFWPLPAIIIATTSLLVAARNFQSAWLMRYLGEENYRSWMANHIRRVPLGLYLICVLAQSLLVGSIGFALTLFSGYRLIPFGIGVGMIAYALAVTVYTLLAFWRIRRHPDPVQSVTDPHRCSSEIFRE